MSITFFVTAPRGPELNMANGNAAQVMDLLGFDRDWHEGGELAAEDLLGRVLFAQALLPVATDDEQGRPEVTDGRWLWCGTRPGYLAGRLAELQELASWAQAHRATVAWG
jgi:hypothetical protein